MRTLKASRAQRDGNALLEYKQTITLNAIQKEADFARALPLVCQRIGPALGDACIPLDKRKNAGRARRVETRVACLICTDHCKG